jgi:AAHS family 4-hydroxybenzoate transporter-like MFS transporter
MLSMGLSLPTVFLIVGIPALLAGATMLVMGRYRAGRHAQLALAA